MIIVEKTEKANVRQEKQTIRTSAYAQAILKLQVKRGGKQ